MPLRVASTAAGRFHRPAVRRLHGRLRRALRGGAATWVLMLLVACAGQAGEDARALVELERLVFVPAAPRCKLGGFSGPGADCSVLHDLVVDRYETTRDDWRAYGFAVPERETWESELGWADVAEGAWPVFASQIEAREFARRRGMRLLRAREWIHLAAGPRGHRYPWGPKDQRSTANTLELGLSRPLPVGTFESGRSEPYGCYDLLGNVWEWCDDRVASYSDVRNVDGVHPSQAPGARVSALGGSYLSRKHETYGPGREGTLAFHAISLDPGHRAPDVGVRLGMEAEIYLWEQAELWGAGAAVERRVEAVGESWGRDALPLIEELAARAGAPENLTRLRDGARRAAQP